MRRYTAVLVMALAGGSWVTASASNYDVTYKNGARGPLALKNKKEATPWETLQAKTLPSVDLDLANKEDEFRKQMDLPVRYAFPETVGLTPMDDDGTWEEFDDGTKVWRYVFTCSNEGGSCNSLSFALSKFKLPDGAEIHIYDPMTGASIGKSLTSHDNNPKNRLQTPIVQTTGSVVFELDLDQGVELKKDALKIETAFNGYKGFEGGIHSSKIGGDRSLSGACNIDVACPEGDAWRTEIKSVALITIDGQYMCSGAAINNERNDRTPYFLTAYHCGVTSNNDDTVVSYWGFQADQCRGPRASINTSESMMGSTLLINHASSAVSLLLLNSNGGYLDWDTVSFAGWDASGTGITSSTGIHHPKGDDKAISLDFNPPTKIVNELAENNDPNRNKLTHWRVIWDKGTTEPGSSGSPLFDQNKRVIGQLHYGSADCDNPYEPDGYGAFFWSFVQGNLQSILAPNSGITSIATLPAAADTPPTTTTTPPPPTTTTTTTPPPPTTTTTTPPPPTTTTPPPPTGGSCSTTSCGNCFEDRPGETGCSCPTCSELVCNQDPYCCYGRWDWLCSGYAMVNCGDCSSGNPSGCGNCDATHYQRGCSDSVCQTLVCKKDSYCCSGEWDGFCVRFALRLCSSCGATCEEIVCSYDSFCCNSYWDHRCNRLAAYMCN